MRIISERDDRLNNKMEQKEFHSREEVWTEFFPKAQKKEKYEDASETPQMLGTKLARNVLENTIEDLKNHK